MSILMPGPSLSRQRFRFFVKALVVTGCLAQPSTGAADDNETSAGHEIPAAIPRIKMNVRVTDPDGKPVAGATIMPVGFRTHVNRGSHYGWVNERHGQQIQVTTDENGLAELSVPKFVYAKLEIGTVTLLVEHKDYVTFREDRSVADAPAIVPMQHGRLMVVSAIDGITRQSVTSHLHGLLSGYGSSQEWEPIDGGRLMSRTVDRKRIRMRLIHAPPNGPLKFSDVVDLSEYGNRRRVLLRDLELHAGVRVEGKLDPKVPRPIRNGTVSATVTVGIPAQGYDRYGQNEWLDWTPINEDGSFVFESLPRNAVAGLIAICDGWICTPPKPDTFAELGVPDHVTRLVSSRVLPQLSLLKGESIAPTIEMESTATCRVKVVDTNGEPVEGAEVGMSPNQMWLSGGSTIVGQGVSLRAAYALQPEQLNDLWTGDRRKLRVEWGVTTAMTRYRGTTNADGIVEFQTLPGGSKAAPRSERVSARHESYKAMLTERGTVLRTTVSLIRDQMTEVTLEMEKLEDEATGRKPDN